MGENKNMNTEINEKVIDELWFDTDVATENHDSKELTRLNRNLNRLKKKYPDNPDILKMLSEIKTAKETISRFNKYMSEKQIYKKKLINSGINEQNAELEADSYAWDKIIYPIQKNTRR